MSSSEWRSACEFTQSGSACDLFEGNGCPVTNVVAGFDWIYYNHVDPAIANININYDSRNITLFPYEWVDLESGINALVNAGVTVVVSAGNHATDPTSACEAPPAHVENAIVVAASTEFDTQAYFSNFGPCVDLYAPGEDVAVASYVGLGGGALGSATIIDSGTSFASPLVAGVAALYLVNHPTATPAQVTSFLLSWATDGKISNASPNTPNELLFSPFGSYSGQSCPP